MGDDVSTYRCRIGSFAYGQGSGLLARLISPSSTLSFKCIGSLVFIGMLLLIAGIEANPGPRTNNASDELYEDTVQEVTLPSVTIPGKPNVSSVTSDSISLNWIGIDGFDKETSYYQLRFKEVGQKRWTFYNETSDKAQITIKGLKTDSVYIFQVRAVVDDEEGKYSDISDDISTNSSLASKLLHFTTVDSKGPPSIHKSVTIPGKPNVSSVTSDSISLNWIGIDGFDKETSYYQLRFKEVGQKRWTFYNETSDIAQITIKGLKTDSVYIFQVRAVVDDEEGKYSDISDDISTNSSLASKLLHFTTVDSKGTPSIHKSVTIPGKPNVSSVTSDSISLNWIGIDGFDKETSYYQLRFKEVGQKRWTFYNETSDKAQITIKGLKTDSVYIFQVRAVVDDEEGKYSDISDDISTNSSLASKLLHFTTVDSKGPPSIHKSVTIPGKPNVSSVTSDSISLNWIGIDGFDKETSYYQLRFKEVGQKRWTFYNETSDIAQITIKGLKTDSVYIFQVRAVVDDEEGKYSDISDDISTNSSLASKLLHFTTVDSKGTPSIHKSVTIPGKPNVSSVTSDSISLNWIGIDGFDKETSYYQLRFKEVGQKRWTFYNETSDKAQITIKGLKTDSVYIFQVRAVVDDEEGKYSDISDDISTNSSLASKLLHFTTVDSKGPPSIHKSVTIPGKPNVSSVTSDSISLNWIGIDGFDKETSYYQLRFKEVGQKRWTFYNETSDIAQITIKGLKTDSVYIFQVRAVVDDEEGKYSDISDDISTNSSLASKLLHFTTVDSKGTPSIHKSVTIPGKPNVSSVTSDSISLNWIGIDGFDKETSYYQLRFKEVGQKRWTFYNETSDIAQITIKGLKTDSVYIFQVRAVVDDEEGKYSDISDDISTNSSLASKLLHFTTVDSKGTPSIHKSVTIPGKPNVSSVTSDSISLNWIGIDGFDKETSYYQLRFKEVGQKRWTFYNETSDKAQITIKGLKTDSVYIFQVRAVVDDEEGKYSDISDDISTNSSLASKLLHFTTVDSKGPPSIHKSVTIPGKPNVSSVTSDSISLNWIGIDGFDKETSYYQLRFKEVGQKRWTFYNETSDIAQITIKGLKTDSVYIFQVRAVVDDEEGKYSDISDDISTNSSLASKSVTIPGKPNVSSVTSDSISLNWIGIDGFDKETSYYQLRFKEVGQKRWTFYNETSDIAQITIKGLKTDSVYIFQVRAVVDDEEGKYSDISDDISTNSSLASKLLHFTTVDSKGTPSIHKSVTIPGKPNVSSVTSDSISLNWIGIDGFDKETSYYQLRFKEVGQKRWTFYNETSDIAQITIKGLKTDSVYIFQVRAVVDDEEGKYSDISDDISTNSSLASKLLHFTTVDSKGTPSIHKSVTIPGKPNVSSVTSDSISLNWIGIDGFDKETSYYQLRFKEVGQKRWTFYNETSDIAQITIKGLKTDSVYIFQVRAVVDDEEGKYSDISDDISTNSSLASKSVTIPGKPNVSSVTSDSISLNWIGIDDFDKETSYYQLRFREVGQKRWTFYNDTPDIAKITIKGLKTDSVYIFQVRAVVDDEEGKYSDISDDISTNSSQASKLLPYTTEDSKGPPSIRKVLITEIPEARNELAKTRKMELGLSRNSVSYEKTILLIGATGSGKSTLVNGIINYVTEVNWNDPFRFKLTSLESEEKINSENQAVSATEWITTYSVHPYQGGRLKYTLNIIDTPGFGDTRGMDRDRKIVDQLRNLFSDTGPKGVLTLEAVCFIVKAPDARLTHSQNYVFNQSLSIFGKDIEENIMYLITFADGEIPPVLSAMKEAKLPNGHYYKFNNSGLFAANDGDDISLSPMFWKMGLQSFDHFFEKLVIMPKKVCLKTKEVLQERERISVTISNLQIKVDAGLCKLADLENDIILLKKHEKEIEDNANYTIYSTETKQVNTDLPEGKITNCLQCNVTCHFPCTFTGKRFCAAIDIFGNCPKKCSWKQHTDGRKKFEYVQVKVARTLAQMEKQYRQAGEKKLSVEELVTRKQAELCCIFDVVLDMMSEVNSANNRLKEIALRPDPLTMVEHIDLMIQSEKDEHKTGYLDRIEILQKYRKEADVGKEASKLGQRLSSSADLDKFGKMKGLTERAKAKAVQFFNLK